jgi:hypothetical protein
LSARHQASLGSAAGKALQQQNYQRLVLLLADPDSGKVLQHAAKIDDLAIAVLADLPKLLPRPLPFAVSDWPRKLNSLADGLRFLASRGVASNLDEMVAKLASVTAAPQLAAVVRSWVDSLPLPQMMPQALLGVRFLATAFTTSNGRIDTLGLENGCPVILEYKRAANENVINQGLFYLDWLMDHR